jgi:DNA polymerase-3 subunit chi
MGVRANGRGRRPRLQAALQERRPVPEFRFHHLERRRIEQALPDFLEAALAEGERVVVQAPSAEWRDALNEKLWTYREDSFLPHGAAGDGDAASQPIYLTDGDETPNGATLRLLLGPADAERFLDANCARVIVLFDSRDEGVMIEARTAWKMLTGRGAAPSYWKEGDEGWWVKAR